MASKLTLWNKIGRFLTPSVVLCFLLPFFGISCDGFEIVSYSGTDMAFGCAPGGMLNDLKSERGSGGGGGMGGAKITKDVKPLPGGVRGLAIAAFAVALVAAGLAWVRTRKALLASCVLAFAGLGLMIGLYAIMSKELKDAADKGSTMKAGGADSDDADSGGMKLGIKKPTIDAGSRWGFWVTSFGFIVIGTLTALALREKETPGSAAPEVMPPPPAAGQAPPSTA